MPFDPSALNNGVMVLTGFGAAFLVVLWVSLIFWTYRDIRSRSRDPLLRILATLISVVLFIPGLVIYLILRPTRTLEEEYNRTLEEEALLQTVEENAACPGCNRRIREEWIVCPTCHTRLKQACPECGRSIQLSWNICPFCAAQISEIEIKQAAPADHQPIGANPTEDYHSGII